VPLDAARRAAQGVERDVILGHTSYTSLNAKEDRRVLRDDVEIKRGVWDGLEGSGHFEGDQFAAACGAAGRLDCAPVMEARHHVNTGLDERFQPGDGHTATAALVRQFDRLDGSSRGRGELSQETD